LYYMDYSSDSSKVTDIIKSDSVFNITGYACKLLTVKTDATSKRYIYTSTLLNDPTYDRTNTIGNFNEYTKATGGAIYLWHRLETPIAAETDSCVHVEQKNIDDHIFDLPTLPIKKFSIETLISPAKFPGTPDRWSKYLQANLDSKVADKYLKLPKGQIEATQKVMVQFTVSETGMLSDIHVVNKDEVHPKLAEEAMRVIRESPRWTPGVVYGEKMTTTVNQPVTFKVVKG